MAVISTVLLTLKDFPRSQAVMYTVKLVLSWKWCKKIEMLLLQITNKKWYMAYQIVANSNDRE